MSDFHDLQLRSAAIGSTDSPSFFALFARFAVNDPGRMRGIAG
jgi:hypothetical protein